MLVDAEGEGPALSSANYSRRTSFGRFFRKVRLDEMLQFFNVIKGDMSLVGPAPERRSYINGVASVIFGACTCVDLLFL
jgi:lipopolysaccharide/colanic/teichoic acid biosynthesis glycosyltransferase